MTTDIASAVVKCVGLVLFEVTWPALRMPIGCLVSLLSFRLE